MNDDVVRAHAQIESALRRLLERADHPRALVIRPDDRAHLHRAGDRVAAQLLGQGDSVLTIALAGCTGSGKSTLINALAGGRIAEAAEQRPCTMQTRVYHHRDVPVGGLPPELASQATFVAHERSELRHKVIVDTPDLDTFATENRAATKALLKAAGLVIYVFSPEKYWEERAWSVIREEQRFSACLAVMNKADLVPASELQKAADEVRRRFAELGHANIPVLPIHAVRHVPHADGTLSPSVPGILDEFVTLRAYIEHELQEGDIARMLRQQRCRVVENLAAVVDRLAPPELPERLDAFASAADSRASAAAEKLTHTLDDRLDAVENELKPLATIRRHQRFFGPLRLWLAIFDFATYGLPRLIRRIRLLGGPDGTTDLEALLAAGQAEVADDLLRTESRKLQDACFAAGLPVGRWSSITTSATGSRLLAEVAREIEGRFDALTAARSGRRGIVTWAASVVGALIPMALAAYALYVLLGNLAVNRIQGGFEILGMMVALTILAYILLHGLVGLALSAGRSISTREVGPQAVREVWRRTLRGWVLSYRSDLESDLSDLHEPVAILRSSVEVSGPPAIRPPAPLPPARPLAPLPPARPLAPAAVTNAPAPAPAPSAKPRPAVEQPPAAARPEPPLPPPPPPVHDRPPRTTPPQSPSPSTTEPVPQTPTLSPAEVLRQAMKQRAQKS